MYKIPISEIKEKIVSSGKMSEEEFTLKVKAKINDLSGLISEEGAAHIIANELGISIEAPEGARVKIGKLATGMNNASSLVKVVQKWEVREFDKGNFKGKVCSLLVGDETGSCRFTLWNDQVDEIKSVSEGDILLIKGAYVKENRERLELHLGKGGTFEINPEGEKLGEVKTSGSSAGPSSFNRKQISSLEGSEEGVELFGTVVQLFDPRFFNVHPETGKRIYDDDDSGVEPALSYVMNLILDDGTGTIRCVFWKNQVNNLLGCDEARMGGYKEDLSTFEDEKTDMLGEQLVLRGRVKHNEMFDRLEFSVQFVEKADPEKEIVKAAEVEEKVTENTQETASSESPNEKTEEVVEEASSTEEAVPLEAVESVLSAEATEEKVEEDIEEKVEEEVIG